MKTIAFVPLRCGSKSIPMKNIKEFCGRPLVFWALRALSAVSGIDAVYAATDCDEIRSVVEGFALDKVKVYMRDAANAQDHSSTESVVLEFLGRHDFDDDDVFILAQATNPLIRTVDLEGALAGYRESGCDSLLSCARLKVFLWNEDGSPVNYDYRFRPRRQEIEGELMENGAFYINTVGGFVKNGNRLCGRIKIYEMPEYSALDIDDIDDWVIAEAAMKKYIFADHLVAKARTDFATR